MPPSASLDGRLGHFESWIQILQWAEFARRGMIARSKAGPARLAATSGGEVNMKFSIALVLITTLGADRPQLKLPGPEAATCQLIVDGQAVEELWLQNENMLTLTHKLKGPTLSLAPGRYRVERIQLKGGYLHIAEPWESDFTLRPDQPHHLRAGAPLKSHVEVKREGRLLSFDYRLTDAAGRRYRSSNTTARPRFTVYQNGREVAGGTFEYG